MKLHQFNWFVSIKRNKRRLERFNYIRISFFIFFSIR